MSSHWRNDPQKRCDPGGQDFFEFNRSIVHTVIINKTPKIAPDMTTALSTMITKYQIQRKISLRFEAFCEPHAAHNHFTVAMPIAGGVAKAYFGALERVNH